MCRFVSCLIDQPAFDHTRSHLLGSQPMAHAVLCHRALFVTAAFNGLSVRLPYMDRKGCAASSRQPVDDGPKHECVASFQKWRADAVAEASRIREGPGG